MKDKTLIKFLCALEIRRGASMPPMEEDRTKSVTRAGIKSAELMSGMS